MLSYYGVTLLVLWGAGISVRSEARTRFRILFFLLLMTGAHVLLETTILNGGTLHRLRQAYVAFLCVFLCRFCRDTDARRARAQRVASYAYRDTAGRLRNFVAALRIGK